MINTTPFQIFTVFIGVYIGMILVFVAVMLPIILFYKVQELWHRYKEWRKEREIAKIKPFHKNPRDVLNESLKERDGSFKKLKEFRMKYDMSQYPRVFNNQHVIDMCKGHHESMKFIETKVWKHVAKVEK